MTGRETDPVTSRPGSAGARAIRADDAAIESGAERAVSDYIAQHRAHAADELSFYRTMPSLFDAIERAAQARTTDGKHSHQRRVPPDTLKEYADQLLLEVQCLRQASSFDAIHRVAQRVGDSITGIGELTVYDTALRIGAKRDLLPSRVHLHRGSRDGAAALGIDRRCCSIEVSELPRAFAQLEAHEIEDCLCIFNGLLSGERRLRAAGCLCSGRGCARRARTAPRARC